MSKATRVVTMPEFIFRASANSPETWQLKAYELVGCANLCFQRYTRDVPRATRPGIRRSRDTSFRVPFMLYAFALECLLKGLRVARGERATVARVEAGDDRHALAQSFKTHKLNPLWEKALMPDLSANDHTMLEFLTILTELGRYPIRTEPLGVRHAVEGDVKRIIINLLDQVDREIRRIRRPRVRNYDFETARLFSRGIRTARKRGNRRTTVN